ncbi:branched-chain amino acid ABC transporter, permease protein [Marvinbryantia formatexigens DSM 14469]|uniref:Branched-chain amino acid ABC transporter, permease protein n=1 Tax=Marvinbryantia formatexigens DSM 14469 TaxID=478749 RepID=C6LL31_9FIRM|nr:ABC transporter permease [Marvinbryantia formatexigens]EET58650.1 branched-chain amino acid ABC transporter, permease protein [Marvinbryantia formatexigens DSM 14469]UWO23372.1 ABC transporter permease [Marvinbryantia formatexigens DSM 14469]SDG39587.1 ribose transport system permease protein [Marvinbryantia formatexigens]
MNNKNQSPLKKLLGIRGMGAALTAFAGLIIIYIAFGLINPAVFSGQNILNLLRSMSKYLLIGIAQSYILITGNIDLSIGSMVGMSAMISATLMTHGVHPLFAILVALLACLATGVVNGYLVGKFKLPPFIATLGTMFVTRGVAYMVNSNRNTDAIATGIGKEAADKFQNFFYYGKTLGVYNTFWIAILVFILFFFILSKTRTGRHIYAIGSNIDAAKLSGVNVVGTTTKAYLVSSVCSCLVGLILCAQAGMGNMEAGNMYEMYGVAAGVIGGVSPLGGTGILLGTLAGAAVWQTLENGLNMIGAQVGIQRLVIGIIVVGAVLLDVVVRSGQFGKKKKG